MLSGEAIYARLNSISGLSEAVSGRIFPNRDPQELADFPNICFNGDTAQQQQTLQGANRNCLEETAKITIQARTQTELVSLVRTVVSGMQCIRQTLGDIPVQGIFFQSDNEDQRIVAELGDDFVVHFNDIEFRVVFDLP